MMTRAIAIGVVALVIAGCSSASDPKTVGDSPWQSQVETKTGLSQEHVVDKVDYPTRPPAGGAHSAAWQNCGFFTDPVKDEAAVHSLEHGAAWFTWQGSLSASQRSFIEQLVNGNDWILASPYPEQPTAFVLTAWGLQLKLDSFEREAIEWFLTTYANGEQTPEPGAPCLQGINTTR
jgi:hypothetical protein